MTLGFISIALLQLRCMDDRLEDIVIVEGSAHFPSDDISTQDLCGAGAMNHCAGIDLRPLWKSQTQYITLGDNSRATIN